MGPLAGKKIIEIAGLGPGPVCGMLLADKTRVPWPLPMRR
jgi:crotonobetainyl-CoA:carnitine CoA-transferase CaiB-like acyl-CoA transferase